jgi:hypothetical protein
MTAKELKKRVLFPLQKFKQKFVLVLGYRETYLLLNNLVSRNSIIHNMSSSNIHNNEY